MACLGVRETRDHLRQGRSTVADHVGSVLEDIGKRDGELGAYVSVAGDEALRAAAAADARIRALGPAAWRDRPLLGVTVSVKDLIQTADLPTLRGSLLPNRRARADAPAVARLRGAGAIVVGKTATSEYGWSASTLSRVAPPTRNPWAPDRTPGGSSGGSAAAVAAGLCDAAIGTDGAGSIRIPASCCGLVGLKPTRGRISRGPEQGDDFLVQDGVLTRTVGETAELLDVIAGYETGDATWAPPPDEPFAALAAREPGRLRIGFTTEAPIEAPLDPECARAVSEAAELLESLGHEVEQASVPWSEQELLELFTLVFTTPIASGVFYGALVTGREPAEELVEPLSWTIWQGVRERSALDYLLARTQLTAFSRPIVALWDRYDVLLTPALAERPVPIGEIDTCSDDPWGDFRRSGRFTPYTAIFNVTGQPAVSLPLFHGDDGLPTCVQLAGRPAGEAALLSLAGQLEAARPWADRRPEPLVRDARP